MTNKNNSFMKTAKVSKVESCKEYSGQNGVTYYHNLIMDNGDEINIGKKKNLIVGDEISYELTGGDDGQQRFKKAKTAMPQNGVGFSKGYEKDTVSILYQTCLKIAGELYARCPANMEVKPIEISRFAGELCRMAKADIEAIKENK